MSHSPLALLLGFLCATPDAAPSITAIAAAPNGKSVVVGSQAGVEIRSLPALDRIRTLKTEMPNVHDLAFSPDGSMLAVGGGIPGKRGMVCLYSWPEGKRLTSASHHRDSVYRIAWHPGSKVLLSASADKTVAELNAETAGTIRVFEGHSRGVLAVAYLPGGSEFVSAGIDETIRVWDAKSGESTRTFVNHTRAVTDLAVRPMSGDRIEPMVISVGADRTVRLWQPAIGRLVRFARVDSVPLAATWTNDGARILVACKDGRLRVLNPETMDVVANRPCIDGVAYCLTVAPDGNVIVGGQDGQVRRISLK